MTTRPVFFAVLATFVLAGVSCDKHSWESTRVLHGHGSHHGADHGHEADAHGKKTEKAEAEKH